jgi:hypothetical protein
MSAQDSPDTSTLIVFYSISGSAGKSYLASLLFEHWRAAADDGGGARPLLVDADLVGATASRVAYAGQVRGVEAEKIKNTSTTLDLISERVNVPADTLFIQAAPWLRCAAESRIGPQLQIQTMSDFQAASKALKATEELPAALGHAQRVQARLARDPAAHKQLWRNLVTAAIRSGPRKVLVDLPAQGPSGVSLDENWRRIQAEAMEVAEVARKQEGTARDLRLVRVLVFGSEKSRIDKPGQTLLPPHPLISHTLEGVRKGLPELKDVVVVENFSSGDSGDDASPSHPRIVSVPLCQRQFTISPTMSLVEIILRSEHDASGPGSGNTKKRGAAPGSGLATPEQVTTVLEAAMEEVPLLLSGTP